MRLKSRVALVTGSTSGIGRGVAVAFAREGAAVVVNHPTAAQQSDARDVCAEIEALGGHALAVRADVADETDVKHLCAAAVGRFGFVDIVVNNAGIADGAPIEKITTDQWDRMLGVHVRGTFLVTRELLPGMYQRGWGSNY